MLVSIWLIVFGVAAFVCIKVHEWHKDTYLWQSTKLANAIRPVARSACLLPESLIPPEKENLKIGILLVYNDADGWWPESLMQRVLRNRQMFASRHGYELINGNKYISPDRGPAWSKLYAMEQTLSENKYDYVMYIDMDAVIMNIEKRLETLSKYILHYSMISQLIITRSLLWYHQSHLPTARI